MLSSVTTHSSFTKAVVMSVVVSKVEVNKIEEIKQQLAELWISSNNNTRVKRCDFRVSVFCQVLPCSAEVVVLVSRAVEQLIFLIALIARLIIVIVCGRVRGRKMRMRPQVFYTSTTPQMDAGATLRVL